MSTRAKPPSDRSFAIVMTMGFAAIAALTWYKGRETAPWIALGIAGAFALAGIVRPTILAPLHRAWLAFGRLLGRFVTPITMGILFYGVVSPLALLMRATRRDSPLHLRFDRAQRSYWILREPPGPDGPSMKEQF